MPDSSTTAHPAPGGQDPAVVPDLTSTSFELPSPGGGTVRGEIDRPAGPVHGRCVLVPAFGLSMLDLLVPAYSLLANGFEVVRFDPTHHVGVSDGGIAGFTLGGLTGDLAAVLDAHGDGRTSLVSISLSARAALRVLTRRSLFAAFFLSPVVNVRRTLREVCGEDLIALYQRPEHPDRYTILGLEVGDGFCADCLDLDLTDLDGTVADARAVTTPAVVVAGSADRWVDIGEVQKVVAALPSGRVAPVAGATHQMFRSPVVLSAYLEVLLQELFTAHGLDGRPVVPPFRELVRLVPGRRAAAAARPEVADRV